MIANREIIHGHSIEAIILAIINLNPIRADVLLVDSQL